MKSNRATSGLLLLVVAAALGAALLYLPPQIIAQYQRAVEAGQTWVYVYVISVVVGGLLFFGSTVWILFRLWRQSRKKSARRERRNRNPSELTTEQQQNEIDENLAAVSDLSKDAAVTDDVRQELDPLVERFEEKRESQRLEIVAFGTVSSGKSSLLNLLAGRDVFQTDPRGGTTIRRGEIPWPGQDQVFLVDTPGLAEIEGAEHVSIAAESARDADLVLVVVDGPLRDSEFELLRQLSSMEKRILICLNKQDWYDVVEQESLLGQIQDQVRNQVQADDIVSVCSSPTERTRFRVQPDGEEVEEKISIDPDIAALANRMMQIVTRDGRDLLLANLLLQSRGLIESARQRVKDALDQRAKQIVERYMWGAGGAAALSPFPLVDLAAGAAVSTKMVIELARVYRQEMDMDAAVALLGQLGKNLISILGVSAATPVVASVVASMLKAVPGAGTIAGGLLQGVVQALVTRWIGGIFIEYFRNEMNEPEGGLAGLARREWDRVTSVAELRNLLQMSRQKLRKSSDEDSE